MIRRGRVFFKASGRRHVNNLRRVSIGGCASITVATNGGRLDLVFRRHAEVGPKFKDFRTFRVAIVRKDAMANDHSVIQQITRKSTKASRRRIGSFIVSSITGVLSNIVQGLVTYVSIRAWFFNSVRSQSRARFLGVVHVWQVSVKPSNRI